MWARLAARGAAARAAAPRAAVTAAARRRLGTTPECPPPDRVEALIQELGEALQEDPVLAKTLAAKLEDSSRRDLLRAWRACEGTSGTGEPEAWQLRRLALLASAPMVGFGFMDNAVMIVCGDFIDATMCFKFGFTTMCAAAIGNIFSDVVGIYSAGPIESALRNLNIKGPGLTPKQMKLRSVLVAKYTGSAIGIAVGCFLGMVPLLWPEDARLWASRQARDGEHPAATDGAPPDYH